MIIKAKSVPSSVIGSILLFSRELALWKKLGPAFDSIGLHLHRSDSIDAAKSVMGLGGASDSAFGPVQLILVDMAALADTDEIQTLMSALVGLGETRPSLVCLCSDANIRMRLSALRAGALDCLVASSEPLMVAARIRSLIAAPESVGPPRVLVVDDQPVAALFASRVLEKAGMLTEQISDPLEVLAAMERFSPDLVLMDLHMPGASGIELTGIIREQERFADLPILFVSAELDPARQLDALRVGGDDFLAKPVPPDILVARAKRALEAARRRSQRRSLSAGMDPQTGLWNRERLLERLDRCNSRAREAAGLFYVECPGDSLALEQIAMVVSGCAQSGDLVARAGEQGIAVLATRADQSALADFGEMLGEQIRVGLSLSTMDPGVGWCHLDGGSSDSVTLLSRARKAARVSLKGGDSRLECYGAVHSTGHPERRDPILAAIESKQFKLLFQPMVDLHRASVERYEITLRLRVPDGELLPPSTFAPLVVRNRLSEHVDRWVLWAGLDTLVTCRDAGRKVSLFLHQSMSSVAVPGWVDALRDGISARDLIHLRPVIQFQVSDVDRHLRLALERASELQRLGIDICLNGLGGDGRGARVLEAIPAAYVRLAGQVVRELSPDRLKDLRQWVQECGARVIATGADDLETMARLFAAGVDLVQGLYVQPPAESMGFDFVGAESSG